MNYLILALATWRISSLLTTEEGPFSIFTHLRHALGVRYDSYSQPYGTNELAKGLICTFCISMWVGILLTITYLIHNELTLALSLPFALSTIAIGFNEWLGEDQ